MINQICNCCGINRRDFLKLTSLFTASAGLSLAVNGCTSENPAPPAENTTTTPSTGGSLDQPVKIGYLPILDASPLLIAHARKEYEAQGLTTAEPVLFRSWASIVEAFLAKQINVVHLLSPITVWLRYGRQLPGKIVAWNHTDGSALTVLPEINTVQDLGGKTIAVPFWYSIHNLVLQQILKQANLKVVTKSGDVTLKPDEVGLVVMPPPEMVSALANKSIAGYIVAEPFNAAAEIKNTGKLLRLTGDVWKNHACCVVFLHEEDINNRPEWTQGVVSSIVKSQSWMRQNRGEVAKILSTENGKYTPHPEAVLQKVLTGFDPQFYAKEGAIKHLDWESQRIDFQPYPFPSYTENLVTLLKETQVEGEATFLQDLDPKFVATDLVDDTFVKKAIAEAGGFQAFNIPESFTREENFAV